MTTPPDQPHASSDHAAPLLLDLNCDLGEDPSAQGQAQDAALCEIVTSINVACTGHAGDDASMTRLAHLAKHHHLRLGAHPSYPDPAGFGRREINMEAPALEASILMQLRALAAAAARAGTSIAHVKPHGALYHAAMRTAMPAQAAAGGTSGQAGQAEPAPAASRSVADALLRAVLAIRHHAGVLPTVSLVVQAGPPGDALARRAADLGLPTLREAFADRAYEPDGTLQPRSEPGALITDPTLAARQAAEIARHAHGPLATPHLHADTLCVHSDSPGAIEIAQAVRRALTRK
jgi:UPF0271 protein